jgi:hypothetical protein
MSVGLRQWLRLEAAGAVVGAREVGLCKVEFS